MISLRLFPSRRTQLSTFINISISIVCLLGLYAVWTKFEAHFDNEQEELSKEETEFLKNAREGLNVFDSCKLYEKDPFDKKYVERFFDPNFNYTAGCVPSKRYTFLKNGKLYITEEGQKMGLNCTGRCVVFMSERSLAYSKTKSINGSAKFHCDIVEVECNNGAYADFHSQIYPYYNRGHRDIRRRRFRKGKHKRHDVYVLVMDSHSHTQSIRNLPSSLKFLKNNMSAVTFPYLNRVGMNSYPNAVALLLGLLVEPIQREMFGQPSIYPEFDEKELCDMPISNRTIYRNASAAGYRTMHAEDMGPTCLGYPYCKGFEKQATDHLFQPQILAYSIDRFKKYGHTKTKETCFMKYQDILNYWKEFMQAYDQPKFSVVWLVEVGHNDQSGSVAFDVVLEKFLSDNQEKLDNSFFFVMGDHGFRMSKDIMQTPLGAYEENNPMLILSVPKTLRNDSSFMDVITENAKSLQTHFDVRATLLDIFGPQTNTNYKELTHYQFRNERGSSLLRVQPQPRNCKTLPIPPQYCLCEFPMKTLNRKNSFALKLGNVVIDRINDRLARNNVSHLCGQWKLGKVIKLQKYLGTTEGYAYAIIVSTSAPYSWALFRTIVVIDKYNEFKVPTISRLDNYRSRGSCVKFDSILCDCRHQERWREKLLNLLPF